MSKKSSNKSHVGDWLIFIAGGLIGALITRFFYNTAIDLTTFLMIAFVVLVGVLVIRSRMKKSKASEE